MTPAKRSLGEVIEGRSSPARDLAARAASKRGNPGEHAITCSAEVASSADVIANRVYTEAFALGDRSLHGDTAVCGVIPNDLVIRIAPPAESNLTNGGFTLTFAPRSAQTAGPYFEGCVRVDHVDAAHSRIVAAGRYLLVDPSVPSTGAARAQAEETLREIVGFLTARLQSSEERNRPSPERH